MICPNCRNEIPDNTVYCPMCGSATGGVPTPPTPYGDATSQPVNAAPQNAPVPNQVQNQAGYTAPPQPAVQNTPYQQGYANPQTPQQGYGYAPNNYTYVNGQPYSVPQQSPAKKKMSPIAIIGIVAGGFVGLIILLSILVAIFSMTDTGGGYSGGGYSDSGVELDTFDFVLSGTYDEEGREIVHNLYGEEIGYVEDDRVYIPIEEGYKIVCDKDGNVIGRTNDTLPGDDSEGDSPDVSENGGDNGAGDYNPPPEGQPSNQPEKGTSAANGNSSNKNNNNTNSNKNNNSKPSQGKTNGSNSGTASTNNVSYDVIQFVDSMFKTVKLHETYFVEGCKTGNYDEMPIQMFDMEKAVLRFEDGYGAFSSYMTEAEYNKAKKSFSHGFCSVYSKSAVEKDVKAIWGNNLSVEDLLNSNEFVSSKGYIVKESADGFGDGAEHYWNTISQEIKGDYIVVKVQMLGYSWYDGSLWDAVKYTDVLADIGAEDSPSTFHEAIERGSVDETKLSCITIYLENTSDGLKLDHME